MADRNPNIPAERRMDMENRERDNERLANERYAQKQAEVARTGDAPTPAREPEASDESEKKEQDQESGKSTR